MVATPYTKLMTAIMDVDMAAAVLLATEARADALGVPADKRVYLRGRVPPRSLATMAARPEPWRSPAMEAAMAGALGPASIDDVAHLDLYSCFASSLAFAGDALGIERRPRPDRHRGPPLPRRPGQQLRHPCPGGHGRGAPARPGLRSA